MREIGVSPIRLVLCGVCLALAAGCLLLGYRHAQLALATRALEQASPAPAASVMAQIEARLQAAAPEVIPASRYLRARWRARVDGPAASEVEGLTAALEDLRWVTARRPTWPPAWVSTVAVKARLHQNDPEFHHALERSLATGPNESRSFTELFPWLRLRWHWLDDQEREALTEFAVRAAWREPKWVVEQAARYYFLDPLCRRSGDNRLASLHCRRLGWIPDEAST